VSSSVSTVLYTSCIVHLYSTRCSRSYEEGSKKGSRSTTVGVLLVLFVILSAHLVIEPVGSIGPIVAAVLQQLLQQ